MVKEKSIKVAIYVGLFVGGAVLATVFAPAKVVTKKEVVEVVREVEVVVEVEVEKIVEVEKDTSKSEKKVTRTETFPDGRIVKEEIYESNEEQLTRVTERLQKDFEIKIAAKEREFMEKYSKEITNPKKITVMVGRNLGGDFGISAGYNLWGPIVIGGFGSSSGVYGAVGLNF